MLEKPPLDENVLASQLERAYNLTAVQLEFLPLGADASAAVYRAVTRDGAAYFVKLRRGDVDTTPISLLQFLSDNGVKHVIPPQLNQHNELWTHLEAYTVTLFPFIRGEDGYAVPLTREAWQELGRTLRGLHDLTLPASLSAQLRYETYNASTREAVRAILAGLESTAIYDAIAKETARFFQGKKAQILKLVHDAERFAQILRAQPLETVLCHDDLHAGNLLIESDQSFYIVDWDDPILAPKERDLMFIGGGLGFRGYTPAEEAWLFYQGYGQATVDLTGIAYYRLERILRDVEAFWHEIVVAGSNDEDRKASLGYLKANFTAGGTVERAYAVNPLA